MKCVLANMKNEIMCNDESSSTKKKKKRQKQGKATIDKQSNTDAGCESEHITEDTSLSNDTESSKKKKHKKKRHNSEDGDEECKKETGSNWKLKETYKNVDDVHKKRKTHDSELTAQPSCDAGVSDRKLKVKKKRKEGETTFVDTSLAVCDNNEPLKKKKKIKAETGALETIHDESKPEPRKKQKVDMHLGTDVETKGVASQKHLSSIYVEESAIHHKKKHSKHKDTSSIDESESKVHKKKHKKHSVFTCDSPHQNNGCISEHESKKDKPSKKHKLGKCLDTSVETHDMQTMADKQTLSSVCEEENTNGRKKKKKHSKKRDASSMDESEHKSHKKKQKNNATNCDSGNFQKSINGDVSRVHLDKMMGVASSIVTRDVVMHVASEQNSSNNCEEEISQHHKKRRKHSKSRDSSLVNETRQLNHELESSSGNNIDSESRSSQEHLKKKTTNSCTDTIQGQWQGDLFESSERQNKFLRLLGGMKKSSDSSGSAGVPKKEVNASANITKKKGLFGSLTSLVNTGSSYGGNAAMSATNAASLNQKLEDEYNRAMNFKLSGKVGTGFGFVRDPAEGKTFHIDVHKSQSIKFDD